MTETVNGTRFETKSVAVKGNRVTGRRIDHYVDGKRVSRDEWFAIRREEKDKEFEAKYGA